MSAASTTATSSSLSVPPCQASFNSTVLDNISAIVDSADQLLSDLEAGSCTLNVGHSRLLDILSDLESAVDAFTVELYPDDEARDDEEALPAPLQPQRPPALFTFDSLESAARSN